MCLHPPLAYKKFKAKDILSHLAIPKPCLVLDSVCGQKVLMNFNKSDYSICHIKPNCLPQLSESVLNVFDFMRLS